MKKSRKKKRKRKGTDLYNIVLVDARIIAKLKAEQEQLKIIQEISGNDRFMRTPAPRRRGV